MPGVQQCAPSCCTTIQTVNVPGSPGTSGTNGINGVSAFSVTTSDFTVPALNATVNIPVANSSWMVIGQTVIVGQGPTGIASPGPASFLITAIPSVASFTGKFLQYPGDVAVGSVIGSGTNTGGANVSPASQGFTTPVQIGQGGTGQVSAQAAANALGARTRILKFTGLNFNVTTDQALAGFPSSYILRRVTATNASISLTTAAGGLYGAAAKGGPILVPAAQAYASLTLPDDFIDLTIDTTAEGPTTDVMTSTTNYLSLTTAQGAAATADLYIQFDDLT